MTEVYLLCLSDVDNFDIIGVYSNYLAALDEQHNLERYCIFDESEQSFHIYCLKIDEFYNYKKFCSTEIV